MRDIQSSNKPHLIYLSIFELSEGFEASVVAKTINCSV